MQGENSWASADAFLCGSLYGVPDALHGDKRPWDIDGINIFLLKFPLLFEQMRLAEPTVCLVSRGIVVDVQDGPLAHFRGVWAGFSSSTEQIASIWCWVAMVAGNGRLSPCPTHIRETYKL